METHEREQDENSGSVAYFSAGFSFLQFKINFQAFFWSQQRVKYLKLPSPNLNIKKNISLLSLSLKNILAYWVFNKRKRHDFL